MIWLGLICYLILSIVSIVALAIYWNQAREALRTRHRAEWDATPIWFRFGFGELFLWNSAWRSVKDDEFQRDLRRARFLSIWCYALLMGWVALGIAVLAL